MEISEMSIEQITERMKELWVKIDKPEEEHIEFLNLSREFRSQVGRELYDDFVDNYL